MDDPATTVDEVMEMDAVDLRTLWSFMSAGPRKGNQHSEYNAYDDYLDCCCTGGYSK